MVEGRASILIVDNDDRIVELVAWFLRKREYEVRTATSFAQARQLIEDMCPDLMLSDIDLGEESALEELPRLDQEGLLPPTLVVSGYLDAAIEADLAALAPVIDMLSKPFDFAALEQRVISCLERAPGPSPPALEDAVAASDLRSGDMEDEDGWVEIIPKAPPKRPGWSPDGA